MTLPLSSSPLTFPFTELPMTGVPSTVAQGVLWCRHALPFALDHINTWLLEDEDEWVIVDTGVADPVSQKGWENILKNELNNSKVSKIVITHYHPDHIGNAHWLQRRTGSSVWMTPSEFLTAHAVFDRSATHSTQSVGSLFQLHGLPESDVDRVAEKGDHYKELIGTLPVSFNRITSDDRLSIGGSSWRPIPGSGHSPDHLSLFCEEKKVLISGDMLLPKISTNVAVWPHSPEGNPLKEFLTSITLFEGLPRDTLVLPSHGLPFIGIHKRVQELKAHHEERLDKILSVCEQPKNAFQILPTLFDRTLDAYQTFFAMGEAVAHLNFLWWEGKLERLVSTKGKQIVDFVKK